MHSLVLQPKHFIKTATMLVSFLLFKLKLIFFLEQTLFLITSVEEPLTLFGAFAYPKWNHRGE